MNERETQGHVRIEELGDVVASPANDSRRAHLADCPRCRALLAAYHEFMAPSDSPPRGELENAERRLALAVEREINAVRTPATPAVAAFVARDSSGVDGARRRGRPVWRLSLAAAALFILGLGVGRAFWRGGGAMGEGAPSGVVLRGDARAGEIAVTPARLTERGLLRLSWRAVSGADAYRVALHGADLAEIISVPAALDTVLEFSPRAMFAHETGVLLFWRVAALSGGDEIACSPLQPLPAVH